LKILASGLYRGVQIKPGSDQELMLAHYFLMEDRKRYYETVLIIRAVRGGDLNEVYEKYVDAILPYVKKVEEKSLEAEAKILEQYRGKRLSEMFTVVGNQP